MEFERRKPRHTHIDMAPLVDVVFLLLLFFMLTFHMATESAITIRLPESRTASDKTTGQITLTVTRDAAVYIDDQAVVVSMIADTLKQKITSPADTVVNIRADQAVAVGFLIQVVDKVRLSECYQFNVMTERRE